jgi:hypothetical protein
MHRNHFNENFFVLLLRNPKYRFRTKVRAKIPVITAIFELKSIRKNNLKYLISQGNYVYGMKKPLIKAFFPVLTEQ